MISAAGDQNQSNGSAKEAQNSNNSTQNQKLGITKLQSNISGSAFTPVFKNAPVQTTSNALKTFLQAHNDAISSQSPESQK